VTSVNVTVRAKKICARPAWLMEIESGSISRTVNPPSTPCAITAPSAIQPSQRTHARGSTRQRKITRPIVSMPTVDAMSRWPCS
jgi:hypothetical protein